MLNTLAFVIFLLIFFSDLREVFSFLISFCVSGSICQIFLIWCAALRVLSEFFHEFSPLFKRGVLVHVRPAWTFIVAMYSMQKKSTTSHLLVFRAAEFDYEISSTAVYTLFCCIIKLNDFWFYSFHHFH